MTNFNKNINLSVINIKKNNIWTNIQDPTKQGTCPDPPDRTAGKSLINNEIKLDKIEIQKSERENWRISMYTPSPNELGNIPDRIEGIYKNDYNILKIHEIIMKRFQWEKTDLINTLKKQLGINNHKLNERISMVERKNILIQIETINKNIIEIETDSKLKEYVYRSLPYIREYKNMGSISNIIVFESNLNNDNSTPNANNLATPEDKVKQDKRHQIIRDYINIARDYINIDLVREMPKGYKCEGCGNDIEREDEEEDNGIFVCPNCNTERISVIQTPFYKDSMRVSNIRNNYEDRENFFKVFRRYQGIQSNPPPAELYIDIDLYLQKRGLPSCEEIKQMPLIEGKRGNTSRDLMHTILSETNNSVYYEDINLICHNCWGWDLVDLSHIEDKIMKDYDLTQKIYNDLPKTRKSSLNSQFRLFKLLLRYQDQISYPIRSRDFRIPSTRDILEWHENIWKDVEVRAWGKN